MMLFSMTVLALPIVGHAAQLCLHSSADCTWYPGWSTAWSTALRLCVMMTDLIYPFLAL